MKKGITIFILLVVIVCSYYYFLQKKVEVNKGEQIMIKDKLASKALTKENKFGNMVFDYSTDDINTKEVDSELILLFNKLKFVQSIFPKKYYPASFSISVGKNTNNKKLSIEEWLDENSFENSRQAPSSYKRESVIISNTNASKRYFYPRNGFRSEYYETIILYIPYKNDVYEIDYYILPKELDPSFIKEDIEQAKDYEKIVDEIIKSIRFVE